MEKISKAFLRIALLSLASDLKRITQSIQRNSHANAQRFTSEAEKWLIKAQKNSSPSTLKLLKNIDTTLKEKNDLKKAESCLMYSVLLQNRAISKK